MTGEERNELIAGQARLEGMIETLTAKVEAGSERTREEMRTLFASRRELSQKVEDIRVDYVPRRDFVEEQKLNREQHDEFRKQIADITKAVTKAGAVVSFVGFLLWGWR